MEKLANTCLLNYTLAASFSREHNLKGGVAIFYANGLDIEVENLNVDSLSVPLVCEIAAVKISWSGRKEHLHILGTYLPPSNSLEKTSEAFEVLSSALESLSVKNSPVVLVGDINIDGLKSSRQKSEFNELLAEYDMARILLPPTRITATSSTSIDTVCSNLRLIPDINVQVLKTGISDHTGQLSEVNFKVATVNPTSSVRRHLNTENSSNLKAHLSCEAWDTVYEACDLESSYNSFIGIIATALDATCPLKKSRDRNGKRKFHSYDKETRRLKTQFLDAQEAYVLSGSQVDKRHTSDLKKLYDMKLKQLRKDANAKLIQEAENKSQAIWKSINLERTQKDSGHKTQRLRIDGTVVTESEALANHFNEYFSTIADKTLNEKQTGHLYKVHVQPPDVEFPLTVLSPTNVKEMSEIIRQLKPKRSAGLDEIS
ncbi:uncharacterized protein LOC124355929 [Homalodisca vitripennis]|uniref:uncharacterized protein LOC124355929 n=1 Tax=Homalodisca vitripennis TaxID=197043 RepID=UPI001EEAFF01|nr:uncharacterized protein LOC124355929 [Homalodisca vitripennis]